MARKKITPATTSAGTVRTVYHNEPTAEQLDATWKAANKVIHLVGEEGLSMAKACKQIGMIQSKFLDVVNNAPHLVECYARAVDQRNDMIANRIIKVANDRSNDFFTDSEGKIRPNPVAVQRDRLIIDSEKWLLSKLAPKKYGDRIQIDAEVKHTAPLSIDQVNDILKQLDSNTIDITPEAEAE